MGKSRAQCQAYTRHLINRKIHWRRDRLPTPVFVGFPCGSAGKESACSGRALGSIPGLGRSPGEGKGYPLQYSGLETSMDCIVHGVTKSRTCLSDFQKKKLLLLLPLWKKKALSGQVISLFDHISWGHTEGVARWLGAYKMILWRGWSKEKEG